jgi:hypothetical protein
MPPNPSAGGLHGIILAGTLLFDEKIRQSATLFWWIAGYLNSSNIRLTSRPPKTKNI